MCTNCGSVESINCCDVLGCVNIDSSDNSLTVEKTECGYDIKFTGNNIDQVIELKDSDCITFTKDFVDGKLVITPTLNLECIAAEVCNTCASGTTPVCPAPIQLSVTRL